MQSHASTCGLLHRRPLSLGTVKVSGSVAKLRHNSQLSQNKSRARKCTAHTCAAANVQIAEDVKQTHAAVPSTASPAANLQEGEDWAAAVEALKHGKTHKMQITQTNKGGVKGQIEGLAGLEVFVPFSKLSTGNYGTQNPQSKTMKSLIGTTIGVKVVAVDVDEKNCVASERAVLQDKALQQYKRGDLVSVKIKNIVPYGAFGSIVDAQTGQMTGGDGLLHISDLSYDHVSVPEDKVTAGETIQCKIKSVNREQRRIQFSLKLMEDDPLTMTLDKLLPADMRDSVIQVPVNIPQGVKDICAELQNEEGIESVFLGRQVEERRVVSQDLELWISKETLEDGFNLVTRAGRTVQELKVTTNLPLDQMKAAIQRVLQRLT